VRLDEEGWQQAAKACDALLARLTAIEQAAAKRSSKDPDDPGVPDVAVALLLFETVKLSQPDQQRAREPKPAGRRRRRRRRRLSATLGRLDSA
jgi:hypothetical protein